ncbi:hypothetical protein [Roseofilum sp. Guam]|nr:hypothetical protein [Roseofilum sp. Guam]
MASISLYSISEGTLHQEIPETPSPVGDHDGSIAMMAPVQIGR